MQHLPRRQTALRHGGVTTAPYPTLRQVLLLGFVAFPVAQFLIYPVVGETSPYVGLVAAELFLLWMAVLALRLRRWIPEDVLLLNAVPLRALWAALLAAAGAALLVSQFDLVWSAALEAVSWDPPLYLQQVRVRIQLVDDLPSALIVTIAVVLVTAVLCCCCRLALLHPVPPAGCLLTSKQFEQSSVVSRDREANSTYNRPSG